MKRPMILLLIGSLITLGSQNLSAATVKNDIDVKEALAELSPGFKTPVWSYNGVVPGTPIVANVGDTVVVNVTNHLKVQTSIHWHGLEVPNDMDGSMNSIPPGGSFTYRFTVTTSGTYWYHSHTQPVLDQLDRGLYGALIVRAAGDEKYASDQIYVLDDWYLGGKGERLDGTAHGMERVGNVETVNGKTGNAIAPLKVEQGEIHKLRFINASTAAVHTLRLSNGIFRVTHTDGHPLTQPYETNQLVLQPAERFDVEYRAVSAPGSKDSIDSENRSLGISIPIVYSDRTRAAMGSPFVPPASRAFPGILAKAPDYTLELNSGSSASGSMMHHDMGSMGGMKMDMSGSATTKWTINGKSFPDAAPLAAKVGKVVKIRFVNKDTQNMHPMDHPMHLHGTFFQVVAINGKEPPRETWKDTIVVPAGGFVDIAFQYRNPGEWMLHCHIIDHEDNGMMTTIKVIP